MTNNWNHMAQYLRLNIADMYQITFPEWCHRTATGIDHANENKKSALAISLHAVEKI